MHALDETSQVMDSKGPGAGARLVARAWVDTAFRSRLLEDGNAAASELGLDGSNWAPRADAPPGRKTRLHLS